MEQIILRRNIIKWFLLICVQSIFAFTFCNAQSHQPQHSTPAEKSTKVKLDNGKKWVANKETTEGINNMVSYVKNFPVTSELKEYSTLNQKLEKEFNQILQRCTMKGEAHNQLHNYLMPLNEYIQQLHNKDLGHAQKSLEVIKHYLHDYYDYFQ